MPFLYCSLALIVLIGLYFFAILGRPKKGRMEHLKKWSYAHRGLHGPGVPENSLAAFQAALEAGYGVELDVHLLADGNMAVIHDSKLIRTTGAEGRIEELTTEELKNYRLEGTEETIPTFREILELFAGKAPLIVELKPLGKNHAALTEATCKMLDEYNIDYCMESFDPRCVAWLKKNRPEIVRGQLSENFFASKNIPLPAIVKFVMSKNLSHFTTRPDFIAYRFADRKSTLSLRFCRKQMECVTWTLTSQADYDTAVAEGWVPIFEGFLPPAHK